MSRTRSQLSRALFTKGFVYVIVLSVLVGFAGIIFAITAQLAENSSESKQPQPKAAAPENKTEKKACCGSSGETVETYTLVGSFYSLKDGQGTTLMFNNKGLEPLVVTPAFYIPKRSKIKPA